jgi:hypothetical protein
MNHSLVRFQGFMASKRFGFVLFAMPWGSKGSFPLRFRLQKGCSTNGGSSTTMMYTNVWENTNWFTKQPAIKEYREYKSDPQKCWNCLFLLWCILSKNIVKTVIPNKWKDIKKGFAKTRLSERNRAEFRGCKGAIVANGWGVF